MTPRTFSLLCATVIAGCMPGAHRTTTPAAAPLIPVHADTAEFRAAAQAIVEAFAAEVAQARGAPLGEVPVVEVRNTPQLILFSGSANRIVVPWWDTQPEAMRAVFRTFAGSGDAEAAHLFRAFFNRFLIAHEAAHWFQARADRREATLYENENLANRLAVAFWRTQPGNERFLAELERLAERAAANLTDPTPAGEDPVAYFGANYQALARDPLQYGYYQLRFMAAALRDRSQLDFARMVGAPPPAEDAVPSHLFVWTASEDDARGSVLAAFDIRPGVSDDQRLLGMVPAGAPSRGAHHTEHALGADGLLFANAFGEGRSFLFDVRDPHALRLLHGFGDVGPYSHPHSFERLPNGHVLATFQWKTGGALPGGLVELDRDGRAVRWASAAPPSADSTEIVPYSLVTLPALDRVVSSSTHMIEDIGVHVQVWRLSDLALLHTLRVPLAQPSGATHAGHATAEAERHRLPAEPRVLADGRTVMFGTFTCGLYHLVGVETDAPRVVFSTTFPGSDCAVPVVVGRWWIQTVPALHALVALDVSDPAAPVEVSRLVLGDDVAPHWLAADASGRLLVTTSASPGDPTLRLVALDPETGALSLDPQRPMIDLRRVHWLDGYTGLTVPHGSVFSRH